MNKEKSQVKRSQLEEVQIRIPDTAGSLSVEEMKKDTDSKFKDVNYVLLSVVIVLLVMVATLIIDSFHLNSATYKEYSLKTESVETSEKANEILLEQIQGLSEQNKKNQKLIIEQQEQILELLNKEE